LKSAITSASRLRRVDDGNGGWTSGHLGIVFRHGGRRYVAALDQPILDEAGQPVEALRDWQVTLITERVAVFSNATRDICVSLEANP
jgi:hypothetical protein